MEFNDRRPTLPEPYTADARAVGTVLKGAGIPRSTSASTRIRGAARVSPGFVTRSHRPLPSIVKAEGVPKDVVRVNYERGESTLAESHRVDRLSEVAQVLRDSGHRVHNRGSELYVWRGGPEAPQR